jgi:DNA-binding beta-propeller fold protein YncE
MSCRATDQGKILMNPRRFPMRWPVPLAALMLLGAPARADSVLVVNATADPSQGNILQYDQTTGTPLGGGPLVSAGSGGLDAPAGLALGPDGNLYVGNGFDSSILKYDVQGNSLGVFVMSGAGGLQGPTSLVFGPDGNLYVASYNSSSVLEYNGTNGAYMQALVTAGAGGLVNPEGMAFHNGNLYVASQGTNQILEYDASWGSSLGSFVPAGAGGLSAPNGLVFGPDGNLYVASQGSDSILRYDGTTGNSFAQPFVAGGVGGLSAPADLIFASNGNLLVASGSGEILSYDGANGDFLGVLVPAGSGGLDTPTRLLGVAVPEPGSLTLAVVALLVAGAARGLLAGHLHRFSHNEAAACRSATAE